MRPGKMRTGRAQSTKAEKICNSIVQYSANATSGIRIQPSKSAACNARASRRMRTYILALGLRREAQPCVIFGPLRLLWCRDTSRNLCHIRARAPALGPRCKPQSVSPSCFCDCFGTTIRAANCVTFGPVQFLLGRDCFFDCDTSRNR